MTETSSDAEEGWTQGSADRPPLAPSNNFPGTPAVLKTPSAQNGSAAKDAGFRQEGSPETSSPFSNSPRQQMNKNPEEVSREEEEEEEDELHCIAKGPPQRMVSWQDEVGRELVTVREFEPSESGQQISDTSWDVERKTCCSIM